MTPFIEVKGAAIPMPMDDVNTDQIIPSQYLKDLHADLAEGFIEQAQETNVVGIDH